VEAVGEVELAEVGVDVGEVAGGGVVAVAGALGVGQFCGGFAEGRVCFFD